MPTRDLEIDRTRIIDQFTEAALLSRGDDALPKADGVKIGKLANGYITYCREHNIDPTNNGKSIPAATWKELKPIGRYSLLHLERANDLANLLKAIFVMEHIRIPDGPRLDVGSGSNIFVDTMNLSAWNHGGELINRQPWYGIDIPEGENPAMRGTRVDRKVKFPGFFCEFNRGEEFPFKEHKGKVQLATLFHVLHHTDPKEVPDLLRKVHDHLAPNGYLIVTEDFIGLGKVEPKTQKFVKAYDAFFYPKHPGHQRPMDEWQKMIEDAGFTVIRPGIHTVKNAQGILMKNGVLICQRKD